MSPVEDAGARVPSIPAAVMEERTIQLIGIARQATELAIATAPNWTGSKLTVEDLQRLDGIRRDLLMMENPDV